MSLREISFVAAAGVIFGIGLIEVTTRQDASREEPQVALHSGTAVSRCVWYGTGVGSCFNGDINKVPCNYPHPSEFSTADWAAFSARCRR